MSKTTDSGNNKPIAGLALVAEGGGQRGAFTAGVFDRWLLADFNPFSILIGTSAGAQNIASLLSGQLGYAYSLISDLTRHQQFFNPWRWLNGKNIMDLDWYFRRAESDLYGFDHRQAQKNSEGRTVRFSTSRNNNYATKLINPNEMGWLPSLKYSSAIPYLYKSKRFVDGGVSAPVPVKEAYELGATSIVTIRTVVDATGSAVPKPIQKLKPILCRSGGCPNLVNIFEHHADAYSQAESFILQPPTGVNVMEIKPQQPLRSKVLGSSKEDIAADYRHGLEMGQTFLNSFQQQVQIRAA